VNFDLSDLEQTAPDRGAQLRVVKEALSSLGRPHQLLLLLRDQLHLPYTDMAALVHADPKTVRTQTMMARTLLRDRVAEILRKGQP
jgi:DNA-directed RNA polymerase specialized sigma24 family protein